MESKYIKQMICNKCGKVMLLDDIDYTFEGNQNEYYLCESCGTGCIAKVRYGKHIKTEWQEND